MSNDVLGSFMQKKKDDSPFISLLNGESIRIHSVRSIRMVEKTGFGGTGTKDVIRLECDVMMPTGLKIKQFDNGARKFAQKLIDKKIAIGHSFTLTRIGEGTDTTYEISDVKDALGSVAAPPVEQAPFPSASVADVVAPAGTEQTIAPLDLPATLQ